MTKIDLHLHSKYSEHPSEWFLQRLGAKESYTEPEALYQLAKERGMNFMTITDHNKIDGALLLKQKYPTETIVGMEATTYFPEDGCKIHVLLYGIDASQYEQIQEKRKNIYELREYIRAHNIAYSIAHATFSINSKLTATHLEKLVLMFDVFEGINGGRSYLFNHKWMELLKRLTPTHIQQLREKYQIEPISNDPWIKSFTGGSDDHSGLFVGETYTNSDADNVDEVLAAIKNKKTYAAGEHNNYKYLAFTVYKVAYEFVKNKNANPSQSMLYQISQKIFESKALNLTERFKLYRLKSSNKRTGDRIRILLSEIIEEVRDVEPMQTKKRLDIVFDKVGDIVDEFFKRIFTALGHDFSKGDLASTIMNLASSLPGIFLTIPFLSTLRHMYVNREAIDQFQQRLEISLPDQSRRILWFTDTINDLNGVAETLKEFGWMAYRQNKNMKIVTSVVKNERDKTLPPNTIFLPAFFTLKLPYYESYLLKFPSLLKSIEILAEEEPAEIYISTPGPIGLLGLLLAKVLNVKCTGIYHTDFTLEIDKIVNDHALTELVETAAKWFYSAMDVIKVPTNEYVKLLEQRGLEPWKLRLLTKGIDTALFDNKNGTTPDFYRQFNLKPGINLLYAGRISQDKHLDFLIEIYRHLLETRPDINLLVVGDGPYLTQLKAKTGPLDRIYFTGRMARTDLPAIYSFADIFVFPSTTDTFGMVVMEAQSCGLPSVVSSIGGPREIIQDGETGFMAKENDLPDWTQKIAKLIDLKQHQQPQFEQMKRTARQNIINRYSWDKCFQEIWNGLN